MKKRPIKKSRLLSRRFSHSKTLILGLAGLMVVIGSVAVASFAQVPAGNPPAIAHRGGPASFGLENVNSTFVKAAKAGYDIELDVRFAKPNANNLRTPWVLHDWALDRTTNCTGGLNSKTDAQLLKCKVSSTERIPTLYEALTAIHNASPTARVIIHVQPADMRAVDALEVGKRVTWTSMQSRSVVMSWLPEHLAYFKQYVPSLTRVRIFTKGTSWYSDPNAQRILPDISELTPEAVAAAKAKGLAVYGSADTPEGYIKLRQAGVIGNICDNPTAYDKWVRANPIQPGTTPATNFAQPPSDLRQPLPEG